METFFKFLFFPGAAAIALYVFMSCSDTNFSGSTKGGKKAKKTSEVQEDSKPEEKSDEDLQKDKNVKVADSVDVSKKEPLDIDTIDSAVAVRKACSQGNTKTKIEKLEFPPTSECPFGIGDNLSKKNSSIRARTEQSKKIELPEGSLLCDMSLEFHTKQIEYDDQMYIVFDRFFLAGSKLTPSMYQLEDELKVYSWKVLQNNEHPGYSPECLGGRCKMPEAEEDGGFDIEIPQSALDQIALKIKGSSSYDFRVITVGDDNDGDCQHSGLSFTVSIKYLK